MAISASSIAPTNSLEDFRIEFNNLVSDVTVNATHTNTFSTSIVFEGATADNYETTLTVTDPTADRTVTLPNLTGTVSLITATETLTNKTLTAPTINGVVGGTQTSATITTFTTTTVNASGVITGSTVEATGDTAADDNAAIGYTAAEGLILTGQGSTNDVTIKNDADADVITIATGGTAVDVVGALTAATVTSDAGVAGTTGTFSSDVTGLTLNATGDTATSDNAAIGYTSAEGLILTGQGSTNDVTIKNDADGDVISIPTGTTNVTIAGDLTISGDDLYMGTNTSGAALIADGTNYNPVVISGDATIATNGALTIASTSVEGSMLNNNVISGLTALTSGLATTDELMVSDAGTLKRMDVSVIADLVAGDATALAIALG